MQTHPTWNFQKQSMKTCCILWPTNVQEEDWQKLDGNENLAYNEVFHYHNNTPKLKRNIKYGKHTRKERIHKIQIGTNVVLIVHTKDVSCTLLILDHILSIHIHMKKKRKQFTKYKLVQM